MKIKTTKQIIEEGLDSIDIPKDKLTKWVDYNDVRNIDREILFEVLEECIESDRVKFEIQQKFSKRLNFELRGDHG